MTITGTITANPPRQSVQDVLDVAECRQCGTRSLTANVDAQGRLYAYCFVCLRTAEHIDLEAS